MWKCSESFTVKSACSNTKWSTKYQTPAKKSLKDSGHRKGLQNVLIKEVVSNVRQKTNTQVQDMVMNSQKVPKVVEVPKQQYTGKHEWEETLSSHDDTCQ